MTTDIQTVISPEAVRLTEAARYASAMACLSALEGDSIVEAIEIGVAALRDAPGGLPLDAAFATVRPIVDLVYAARLDDDAQQFIRHKAGVTDLRFADYQEACAPFAQALA